MSFVNFSNHSSKYWSKNQIEAARAWGEIVDIPFPNVEADCTEEEIRYIAESTIQEIMKYQPQAVLCQGEFTLSYAVIRCLRQMGIMVCAACSKRIAEEICLEDGISKKESQFEFVRFRKYE